MVIIKQHFLAVLSLFVQTPFDLLVDRILVSKFIKQHSMMDSFFQIHIGTSFLMVFFSIANWYIICNKLLKNLKYLRSRMLVSMR